MSVRLFRKPFTLLLILLLLVGNIVVYIYLFHTPVAGTLTVSFLDVGQGDSILVTAPSGIQMLIDGGKDRSVVRALPWVMGPLDRTIEVLVATHPDADHIGGLPDVLSRYKVRDIFVSGKESDSDTEQRFEYLSNREPGATTTQARKGMRIHLGEGVYADVLHPGDNVELLRETNDASIVMRLVYGDTEFLFTGDAPSWVEDRLVREYGYALQSDVLKAGHHGSKTSTDTLFLETVNPDTVVISAGKDNSYGHPHEEVLQRIRAFGASVVSTMEEGTITYISDGYTVREK